MSKYMRPGEKHDVDMDSAYPLMEEGENKASKNLKHSPDGYLNQTTKKFANTQWGKHPEAEEEMGGSPNKVGYHMVQHPQHGVEDPTPGYGVPMKMKAKKVKY